MQFSKCVRRSIEYITHTGLPVVSFDLYRGVLSHGGGANEVISAITERPLLYRRLYTLFCLADIHFPLVNVVFSFSSIFIVLIL